MLFGEAFQTPWWLRGGHAQTILPARFTRHRRIVFRRERWDTPDGDFIDLDWTTHPTTPGAPLVVMFHGQLTYETRAGEADLTEIGRHMAGH